MSVPQYPPLLDSFGRRHTSLRLSVTDRCNIRCFYCMPLENIAFRPRSELLTFEEIVRVVHIAARHGVRKLRITGGEPLVRAELDQLIRLLRPIPGIEEVALTTNAMLLAEQAVSLKQAGLDRLNISLDTLSEEKFQRITRRQGVDRVLAGIASAQQAGFTQIRLNAIAVRGLTEDEIVPLAQFARQHDLHLRFIEFMPLDADRNWNDQQVLSGHEVRTIIDREVAPLVPIRPADPSQPAVDFAYADGRQKVGVISSVTEPFCQSCNRLRLTAEGQLRNCLFSTTEWDLRQVLRSGGNDEEISDQLINCVAAKKASHGIDTADFVPPARAMYQIGG